MNNLFLRALRGHNEDERPPVWLMRQAGRYMPEYQALRKKYTLMEMFHSAELIEQVTLLPIDMLGVDAAILFSDILLTAEALGKELTFEKGKGPVIANPVRSLEDIAALPEPDIEQGHRGVFEGIRALRKRLDVPLIGFAGAPLTVASYMIEGGSSKDMKHTRLLLWDHPTHFQRLLDRISQAIIQCLQQQIQAGVQAIQLFDSWAQILSHKDFVRFCLPSYKKILDALKPTSVPVIIFGRGTAAYYQEIAALNPAGISVDWPCNLRHVREAISSNVAIQGNFDPHLLYASESVIVERVWEMLREMEGDPAYIFNLGHGVFPDVSVSAVKTVVEAVKTYTPQLTHSGR